MKYLVSRPLTLIIIFGAILRILFVLISDHIYYPDEIFQTVELSYRLSRGYSIIPWDFIYGIRSMLVPVLLSFPILFLDIIIPTSPTTHIITIKLILSLFSLAYIPAAYLITFRLTNKRFPSLLAALIIAFWYELIYFSPRALSEVITTTFFSLTIVTTFGHRKYPLLAGFSFILGLMLRPQYLLLALGLGYWLFNILNRKAITRLIVGIILGLSLIGIIDILYYQQPFIHLYNYFRINYISGISSVFDTQPPWYYLYSLLIASFGLYLISLFGLITKSLRALTLILLITICIHSLIPHKEYRFIFGLIPIIIILISVAFYNLLSKYLHSKQVFSTLVSIVAIMSLISLFGILGLLPQQEQVYNQPPLLKDPQLQLIKEVSQYPTLCGLYLPDIGWVNTGGYYYLAQNVPLYSNDYPPTNERYISHIIVPSAISEIEKFTLVKSSTSYSTYQDGHMIELPGYSLFASNKPCLADKNYRYIRSFSELDSPLNNHRTYQF